jgi:hypothetical protein
MTSRFPIGSIIENGWASTRNPTRVGIVIEHGSRGAGQMNAGPFIRLTDGKGKFWELSPRGSAADKLFIRGQIEWPDLSKFITSDEGLCS